MTYQDRLFDEIIVDNFAGGGGASIGMELATGRIVEIAVNHDAAAVAMHAVNHPYTRHYQENVWNVDPRQVCSGRPVGLAWFSPDCRHFSKAKGAALCDRHIRGLAWVVLRWAALVRPRVIMLENVEEFKTWGPLNRGRRPIKAKVGVTFQRWLYQLRGLGYAIDWRELTAADYGAPTSRKRLFIVARCDGRPIVWPEPTHAPRDSEAVRSGRLLPWRSAAEIIGWTLLCPSIFATKQEIKATYGIVAQRPLRPNTLRRIARGVDKFTIKCREPFLVQVNHGGGDRAQGTGGPLPTVTGRHGYGIAKPVLAPYTLTNTSNATGTPADRPLNTARTGGGGGQMLVSPVLTEYHAAKGGEVRAGNGDRPLLTVDGSNRFGLAAVQLTEYYGAAKGGASPAEPLHTVTGRDRQGLTVACLQKYHCGGYHGKGASPDEPAGTFTSNNGQCLVAAQLAEFKGQDKGQAVAAPLRTITAGDGQFGLVECRLEKIAPGAELYRWPEVRQLLNDYAGYTLAEDKILLLRINGADFFIADVGLRMLSPRELYLAMGFPPDYEIERGRDGKPFTRSSQVARCGNAVCPVMSEALVRANLPEWCGGKIHTMAQLEQAVTA